MKYLKYFENIDFDPFEDENWDEEEFDEQDDKKVFRKKNIRFYYFLKENDILDEFIYYINPIITHNPHIHFFTTL